MANVDSTYRVGTALTLNTVTAAAAEAVAALSGSMTIFDFAGVREVDSSALAFILVCQREALRLNKTLQCMNVPDNLKNLAALYGVDAYLPF